MTCLFCQVGCIETESQNVLLAGLLKVILWLLHPDPNSRATIKDLQADKWTNQPVNIDEYMFEAVINGEAYYTEMHDHKNMSYFYVANNKYMCYIGWSCIRKEKSTSNTGESNTIVEMKESLVMKHNGNHEETKNSSNCLATSL